MALGEIIKKRPLVKKLKRPFLKKFRGQGQKEEHNVRGVDYINWYRGTFEMYRKGELLNSWDMIEEIRIPNEIKVEESIIDSNGSKLSFPKPVTCSKSLLQVWIYP